MSKRKITAIIIAVCLIFVGTIISAIALTNADFDFSTFDTVETENNTYEITETFSEIDIDSAECDIKLLPATDGVCKVICSESDKISHDVAVENDTLTVKRYDNREWYEHIGIYSNEMQITVYLPKTDYQKLNIRTVSGDICISDINVDTFNCKSTSGDVELLNVVALNDFAVKTTSGDIDFAACDCKNISLKSTSGDVEGSLLSGKNFIVDTTSGDIDVPRSSADGGECRIITTSGDIEIQVN